MRAPAPGSEEAWPSEFRRGIASSMPILIGLVPYALVLGAQATQKGFSVVEVPLMTGLNFAGGAEFAALQEGFCVGIRGGGGSVAGHIHCSLEVPPSGH